MKIEKHESFLILIKNNIKTYINLNDIALITIIKSVIKKEDAKWEVEKKHKLKVWISLNGENNCYDFFYDDYSECENDFNELVKIHSEYKEKMCYNICAQSKQSK